jgi:hypothetical protein
MNVSAQSAPDTRRTGNMNSDAACQDRVRSDAARQSTAYPDGARQGAIRPYTAATAYGYQTENVSVFAFGSLFARTPYIQTERARALYVWTQLAQHMATRRRVSGR